MKQNMPEYISVLSDNNYDIFEEIFIDKYKNFIEMYWLIRNFSENTKSLKYKTTKKNILKIELIVENIDVNKVLSSIKKEIKDKNNINVELKDSDKIKIEIYSECEEEEGKE